MKQQAKKPGIIARIKDSLISYFGTAESIFIVCAFLAGIILMIIQVFIYRDTLIPIYIPLSIFLIPGIILTPVFYHLLNSIEEGHWLLHYFLHTCMTGGFLTFLFMFTNMYFRSGPVITERFPVVRTGELGSRRPEPYVVINYEGIEKEIFAGEAIQTDTISVSLSSGFFGFKVIESIDAK